MKKNAEFMHFINNFFLFKRMKWISIDEKEVHFLVIL